MRRAPLRNLARFMSSPTLSFVLPAHNEVRNVAGMAQRLAEIARPFGDCEIIFVDDGSTDGTLTAVRALAAADPAIRYVSFTRNFGHQAALRAGLRYARGRAVIAMDCDFEHPPEVAAQLVQEWQRGAKVVVTRRLDESGQNSATKKATSRLFYRVLDALGDVHIEPGSADFMLLDRAAVDVINALEDQDVFLRGLVRWLGFPLATVDYVQGVRQAGTSSFTLRRMVNTRPERVRAVASRRQRPRTDRSIFTRAPGRGAMPQSSTLRPRRCATKGNRKAVSDGFGRSAATDSPR